MGRLFFFWKLDNLCVPCGGKPLARVRQPVVVSGDGMPVKAKKLLISNKNPFGMFLHPKGVRVVTLAINLLRSFIQAKRRRKSGAEIHFGRLALAPPTVKGQSTFPPHQNTILRVN